MMRADLQTLAQWLEVETPAANPLLQGVATDTRKPMPGALFVALKGERFDGHAFVAAAREQGAAAALVSQAVADPLPQIMVDDTRLALGRLAQTWRQRCAVKCVALTGSCGKTTVKEMLASIFRTQGETLATEGNLNNDLGVPLTLLKLSPQHAFAVIEMGANHIGEIDYCARLAQPDVGLITLVAPAHLEGFGSIDGVAEAKSEIYAALPARATAVINADDAYAALFREVAGSRHQISFGRQGSVHAEHLRLHADGCAQFDLCLPQAQRASVQLPLPGVHNVQNALSAAACAYALGVPVAAIAEGLAQTPTVNGRLVRKNGKFGGVVIDDTYNANLGSVKAAIAVLAACAPRRTLVLGDMGELGHYAEDQHAQAGAFARDSGIEQLFTLGPLSAASSRAFGAGAQHFETIEALLSALHGSVQAGDSVLVKGSRSARMERVVAALCVTPAASPQPAGETH